VYDIYMYNFSEAGVFVPGIPLCLSVSLPNKAQHKFVSIYMSVYARYQST